MPTANRSNGGNSRDRNPRPILGIVIGVPANGVSMYGPPPRRKRRVSVAGTVCAYVYGLVGVFNGPGPCLSVEEAIPYVFKPLITRHWEQLAVCSAQILS
jgi:hypothetical protein